MFEKNRDMDRATVRAAGSLGRNIFFPLIISFLFLACHTAHSLAASLNGNGYYGNGLNGNGYYGNGLNGTGLPIILKSIAILPLENLGEEPGATDVVTEFIKKELKGKGWVLITKSETVEQFLAKRRIRHTGAITRLTVREMGKVLGIDAVLVGCITQFSTHNGKATVGVSARLISALDGSLIWADNRAYTTRDFEGILGLGAVTSVKEVSSIVVKDLVMSIADRFFIREATLSPFEIERVAAYPTVGKGGDKVDLKVKVLPIMEEPKEVKAIIEGNEVDLTLVGDGEYEGSVIAPQEDGVYFVDVIAMGQNHAPFTFGAAGKIVVDNTPPVVSMSLDKNIFASSKKHSVIFTARLLNLDDIDEWKMEIMDREGKLVRDDRGYGKIPEKLIWRGETNKRSFAKDGKYTCRLTVRDIAGNETVITEMLTIKNNPPDIKIDVDVLDDILLFTFNYGPDERIKSWEFSIKDRKGNVIKKIDGEGDVPEKIEYPLDEGLDFRRMTFSVTALDEVGNTFNMTKAIPSLFTGKTPFARLKNKGKINADF
jgi:TolB-like protein